MARQRGDDHSGFLTISENRPQCGGGHGPGFQHMLREAALRVTRPRVAVLNAVYAHPHADTDSIIGEVRRGSLRVPPGRVRRAASANCGGSVRRIQPSGSVAAMSRGSGDHRHVVCRSCGVIPTVDCAVGTTPCLTASDDNGFEIDEAEVVYWGLCLDCSTAPVPDHTLLSQGIPVSDSPDAVVGERTRTVEGGARLPLGAPTADRGPGTVSGGRTSST